MNKPITPEQMSEWVTKTWRECQESAWGEVMTYTVVVLQDGETARLPCATLEEAEQVRQSFINYGKCQEVRIEIKEQ